MQRAASFAQYGHQEEACALPSAVKPRLDTEESSGVGQVYVERQRHNTKLWAHVNGALSGAIAQIVCGSGSQRAAHETYQPLPIEI